MVSQQRPVILFIDMNEQKNDILPSPQTTPEHSDDAGSKESQPHQHEAAGSAATEQPGAASQSPPVLIPGQSASSDDNTTTVSGQGSDPLASVPSDTPLVADDVDLIEKEWVHKAKEIVERTKQDPFLQNKEIGRLRADYMKKRYDKDIKLQKDE